MSLLDFGLVKDRRIRGQTLRSLRQEAKLSYQQLAERIPMSPGYLRNCEGSKDEPGREKSDRLAEELTIALGRTITVEDFSVPHEVLPRSPRRKRT